MAWRQTIHPMPRTTDPRVEQGAAVIGPTPPLLRSWLANAPAKSPVPASLFAMRGTAARRPTSTIQSAVFRPISVGYQRKCCRLKTECR